MPVVWKVILGAFLLGCILLSLFLSPVTLLNAFASLGDYRLTQGLAYADGDRHSLDIYQPKSRHKPAPVVIFFYGGSWDQGSKTIYRFVGAALAEQGFVTIIPDYRLYPEVRFPGFLQDAAQAVAWARDHAVEYGGDPHEIVLMGHSAGAHIAAMLTFDSQWLAAVDLNPSHDIKAMVGLAGPYDFLPLHSDRLKDIFGPPAGLAATQPINFVTAAAPPVFLGAPQEDSLVKPKNTINLAARITQQGGHPTVKFYSRVSHLTLIGCFSGLLRWMAPVVDDTAGFIREMTDKPAASAGFGRRAKEPA
jgi:acetyl esterase/lipase